MKKLLAVLAVVALLSVVLVSPVLAAPVAQSTPVEQLTPIAAWLFLSTFLIPPAIALLKRWFFSKWDEAKKDMAVFVVCLFFGLPEAYFNGSLKLANGDGGSLLNLLVINAALTVMCAFGWYKMFWKPSTVDDKISGVSK